MLVLTLLSAWFYIAAYPLYIFLLLGLIAVDYGGALLMERLKGTYRKLCFALCIFSNVGLLASFKYWNFIAENLNLAGASLPQHDWILPVGLSFHTFQSLSYLIEVHRKSWPAERNLLRYSLYILFFPQMVAGPIERPQNILPQFLNFPKFNKADFRDGLFLLAKGLFMKVAVADRLAVFSDPIFNAPAQASAPQVMLAMAFFMLQIYADFSGYSNMALGTARMLGIKLMLNFRKPYLATSLADFWRRWHISLSTWFRDYIYIPLGGNRNGIYRAGVNLMIVFLLSGLWHGAGWNFIIWGALHGLGILAENYISAFRNPNFKTLNWLRTQLWVMGCWVFFRSISFAVFCLKKKTNNPWTKRTLNISFTYEEIVSSIALFLVIPTAVLFRWHDTAF